MHPKDFRLSRNLSVPQIAEDIGVTTRAIYQYEANERRPRQAVITKYREISDGQVTADDFFTTPQAAPHSSP